MACRDWHMSVMELSKEMIQTTSCKRWIGHPPEKRIWAKIKKGDSDECWPYIGATKPEGYGFIMINGRSVMAHRFIWEFTFGPITGGLLVCHKCDNPPCCNPAHLFLGTPKDNLDDCKKKGRWADRSGEKAGNSKLTNDQIFKIREMSKLGFTQKQIGSEIGTHYTNVGRILNAKRWCHI